jgi:hypothetical protein
METITHIQTLPIATDDGQGAGMIYGDILGQMMLAQSRLLDALARRDRPAESASDASPQDDAAR